MTLRMLRLPGLRRRRIRAGRLAAKAALVAAGVLLLALAGMAGVALLPGAAAHAAEAGAPYLWSMDTPEEVATYGNDNTGATFQLNSTPVLQGTHSVAVIPNGQAQETKLALSLDGDRLAMWKGHKEVVLNVYLPPENALNPTMFFLGMADVTGQWTWVGGVFSQTATKPGWNEVRYVLADNMQNLDLTHKYMVYLAFAAVQSDGKKVPLTQPFLLDGLRVESAPSAPGKSAQEVTEAQKQEVANLLKLDDAALVDAVSRQTFAYFWNEANPQNGLIRDRSTANSPCSIAAVGFGLAAIPLAIERGWIPRDEGYDRVLTTLKTFASGGVEGRNGFFYHFVTMSDGRRYADSEVSSIDTGLFIAGALFAGQYFAGTEVAALARQLYENVDWTWMLNGGDTLSMGWKPEGGFLDARWNSFNEGLLLYFLAVGSPTHPIPAAAWDQIYRPVKDNYISLPAETLFVYQYPQVWIDFRGKEDKYANYWNNAVTASRFNRLYSVMHRFVHKGYDMQVWGLSAGDGPSGYQAYGASDGNNDGTIVPYASLASMPFVPELSLASMRGMLQKYGPLVWGKYGFVSGFNVDQNWFSDQYIGIDEGDALLMMANYRSGFVWKYFMQIPYIQAAMKKLGFKASSGDYAVTPAYAEEFAKLSLAPKEKKVFATPVAKPVAVDGSLDEWQGLTPSIVDEDMNVPAGGLVKVDKRKQILNSKFFVQWDAHYLYLAADVADEVVVSNIAPGDKTAFYRTDSVEFYIDPSRAGSKTGLFKLAILPFDTAGHVEAIRWEDAKPGPIEQTAPGTQVASKRTDRGYALEAAIPWQVLGIGPAEGMTLGFDYVIHNSNNKDAQVGQYVRTNVIAWSNLPEVWARPDLWGNLVLSK